MFFLTLLHSERPKLFTILVFLSAIGLNSISNFSKTRCDLSLELPEVFILSGQNMFSWSIKTFYYPSRQDMVLRIIMNTFSCFSRKTYLVSPNYPNVLKYWDT